MKNVTSSVAGSKRLSALSFSISGIESLGHPFFQ